jgi:two-component system sensor histidine kinase DesK
MNHVIPQVGRDIGRGLDAPMGVGSPGWHLKSRRPDVPGGTMRAFWLVYLVFVFVGPLREPSTWVDWALAAASIGIFLPLYFGVWRAIDRRPRLAVVLNIAIAVMGLALIPWNVGANSFVIYSAAHAPFVFRPRSAAVYLLSLAAAVALVSLSLPEPMRFWLVLPTTVLIFMVGGGNLFYAEHHRRNALLWQAREDVEEMAALAERERISRDLHDLLGHTLSVIALKSELASKLADTDPARAADEIRDVERVSRDALTEVRAAVEGFQARGFSGELRNAARALESAGVRLEADSSGVQMSARQEGVMALVLREAVTNVVRHAKASVCRVRLTETSGELVLTIQDDGVGGPPADGHGLSGMRQRIAAAGGTLSVESRNGFTVDARLPLPAMRSEPNAS